MTAQSMADVIRDANIDRELAGGDDADPPIPFEHHIAAAVAAWMQSDAVVKRAARAMFPESPATTEDLDVARRAIAAIVGGRATAEKE